MAAPAVPFSYAQAARGKAPSSVSTPQLPPKKDASSWAEDSSDARTLVEEDQSHVNSTDASKKQTETAAGNVRVGTKQTASSASSPDMPASSSSTLKEDDAASDPKTPSDHAWDVKSQASASAANTQEAGDQAAPAPKSPELQQESKDGQAPKQLKEAPIPMVNFWQQRALDAKAKQPQSPTTTQTVTAPAEKPSNVSPVAPSLPKPSVEDVVVPQASANVSQHQRTASRSVTTEQGPTKKVRSAKDEAPLSVTVPPPSVQDQTSWPTPVSAQDEGRRRATEKGEKERAAAVPKPHTKSEWTKVDFTPTVKFNTPIPSNPRRGGRGGSRGGRDTGSRGGSISERADVLSGVVATSGGAPESGRRGRTDSNTARSSVQPDRSKRASSANQAVAQEAFGSGSKRPSLPEGQSTAPGASTQAPAAPQRSNKPNGERTTPRKAIHGSISEKPADPVVGIPATQPSDDATANRRRSMATQTDEFKQSSTGPTLGHDALAALISNGGEQIQLEQSQNHAGNGTFGDAPFFERRNDPTKTTERQSESWQPAPPRERGEGRPERGRGGRNGRGGSHSANLQLNAPAQYGLGYQSMPTSASRTQSGYQSPMYPPFVYAGQPQQGRRSELRSASIPSDASYGRFVTPYYPATPTSPYPQYVNGVYDFPGMSPVSAMPYDPLIEHAVLMTQLDNQLNYYFSLENMVKDTFLRSHMDSQGFVSLKLIANFKKMKELSTDYELIKYVCLMAPEFDMRPGLDGSDRIRKKSDWQRWVLNVDQRDSSAQNDGPPALEPSTAPQMPFPDNQPHLRSAGPSEARPIPPGDSSLSNFAGVASFEPIPIAAPINGTGRSGPQSNRHSLSLVEGELSYRSAETTQPAPNGMLGGPPEEPDSFPDNQISYLTVVARPRNVTTRRSPNHSASRTFSNGSIDGRSLTGDVFDQDERKSRSRTRRSGPNGPADGESTPSPRFLDPGGKVLSRSPSSRGSTEDTSNLYWIKEKESPVPLPSEANSEQYTDLHFRALQHRLSAATGECPPDMALLYEFWSHFLIRNFNTRMYDEFRRLSHEDASQRGSDTGFTHLTKYYSEALSSQNPIRERVARHYVQLVLNEDHSKGRPIFEQLRAAWRNGALNLKNRKKLMDTLNSLDPSLREQLDS